MIEERHGGFVLVFLVPGNTSPGMKPKDDQDIQKTRAFPALTEYRGN